MKRIHSNILSFLLAILITFFIIFNVVEYSIRKHTTVNYLVKSNYIKEVHTNITKELGNLIVEENLEKDVTNFFSKKTIQNDIVDILNKKEINHNEKLTSIISNYTTEKNVIDNYVLNINKTYKNNLFPIKEHNIIYKLYFGGKILFIDILVLFLINNIFAVLYFMNDNFKYHKIALFSVSFILIIVSIISKLIFINFNYINEYFTHYFTHILNINIYAYILISGIILLMMCKPNTKKNQNKS